MHFFRTVLIVPSMLLWATSAPGQLLKTVEAEKCRITCLEKRPPAINGFASGNRVTPEYWGADVNDSIEWEETFQSPAVQLRLAVRYAYDRKNLQSRKGADLPEELTLIINNEHRIPVPMKDTLLWDLFQTVAVDLPELPAGRTTFRLQPSAPGSDRNVDCFYFVRGPLEKLPLQRRTNDIAHSADGKFAVWIGPDVGLRRSPEEAMAGARRIYDFLKAQTSFEPAVGTIGIHVLDDKYAGSPQFKNDRGIWFSDADGSFQPGGWCHEMNHFFTPYVPSWFSHPLIRVNDTFITIETLFPEWQDGFSKGSRGHEDRRQAGLRVLSGRPWTIEDPHDLAYALHLKYGKDLLPRFYQTVVRDVKEGTLVPPGGVLSPDQMVEYMSRAAGENLRPLFERLRGWPNKLPDMG